MTRRPPVAHDYPPGAPIDDARYRALVALDRAVRSAERRVADDDTDTLDVDAWLGDVLAALRLVRAAIADDGGAS